MQWKFKIIIKKKAKFKEELLNRKLEVTKNRKVKRNIKIKVYMELLNRICKGTLKSKFKSHFNIEIKKEL